MSLIKLYKIGYGISGDTLDFTVSIPDKTYIKEFWVANQDDIPENSAPFVGRELIKEIMEAESITDAMAFGKLFKFLDSFVDNGITYNTYTIDSSYMVIPVNKEDLLFVTVRLETSGFDFSKYGYGYGYGSIATEFTNRVETFTLFDITTLRLKALAVAEFYRGKCVTVDDFVDRILQIKTIEYATLNRDFYRAATYWKLFYKQKV